MILVARPEINITQPPAPKVMDIHPHISFHHVHFSDCVCLRCWHLYFSIKIIKKAQIPSLLWTSSVPRFNCINIICMSWVSDPYQWRPNRLPMSRSIFNHLKFQALSGADDEQWKLVMVLCLGFFLSFHFFFDFFPFHPSQCSAFFFS